MFVNTLLTAAIVCPSFNELQISSKTFAKDFDIIVVLSSLPYSFKRYSNGVYFTKIITEYGYNANYTTVKLFVLLQS